MIGEGVILLRIEYLQQSGSRVAAIVIADLINLIEQNDRIGATGAADLLNNSTRLRADIGTAETA